jgi:hypothetical protein
VAAAAVVVVGMVMGPGWMVLLVLLLAGVLLLLVAAVPSPAAPIPVVARVALSAFHPLTRRWPRWLLMVLGRWMATRLP